MFGHSINLSESPARTECPHFEGLAIVTCRFQNKPLGHSREFCAKNKMLTFYDDRSKDTGSSFGNENSDMVMSASLHAEHSLHLTQSSV
jgi:hypothetical protein